MKLSAKFFVCVVILIFTTSAVFSFFILYEYTTGTKAQNEPVLIEIPKGYSRQSLAVKIGGRLDWTDENEKQFEEALTGIQWDAFNHDLLQILSKKFDWGEEEKEIFLTSSPVFLKFKPDILDGIYLSGLYEIASGSTPAEVSEIILNKIKTEYLDLTEFLEWSINEESLSKLEFFIDEKMELLPDLIPLPPQDLGLRREGGKMLLVFSTTYYNIGEGDLEIVADPKTANSYGDISRIVYQKILRRDGDYQNYQTGVFEWHQEHLHYHFEDFIKYTLENEEKDGSDKTLGEKATFCLRDITKIYLEEPSEETEESDAKFLVCGKERQGVSVGWGDTYFQTYADQNFDVTDLPSGRYLLSFYVNPERLFKESSRDNNRSSALIEMDKEKMTVEILEISPKGSPNYKHVHKVNNK